MTPTRPYRALRAGVGTIVIGAFVGLWIRGYLVADPLGTLWDVVMLVLLFAGAIAVFGRRTMQTAVDEAQEIRGQGDQEGSEDA